MGSLIVWLIIGLVAGAAARFLVPGKDPMGWLGTLILGLVGSVVGGFLGGLLLDSKDSLNPAGIFGSVVGAVIVLLAFRFAKKKGMF